MNDMPRPAIADAIRPDWIPADLYRGEDVARLERERLWPRVWQMACREVELRAPGDFVNYEILDDSILIVRTGEGADDVVAYYNVCQHRGRKLRTEARGNLGAQVVCRFHGWQWTIEGALKSVHFAEDWKGCPAFSDADLSLPRVKVARWGGWIWINQDEDAEPLLDFLGAAAPALDVFAPESLRPVWWKTIIAPVNWKIVVEAFNEGYHSFATHTGSMIIKSRTPTKAHGRHSVFHIESTGDPLYFRDENGKWANAKSVAEAIWAGNHMNYSTLGALTLEPSMEAATRLREEMAGETDAGKVVGRFWQLQQEAFASRNIAWPEGLTPQALYSAAADWHIFPNSICLPTVDGALWYRVRPHRSDPDRCIFDIWSFGRFAPGDEPEVTNDVFDGFEAFRGTNPFLEEDFSNMLAVNEGTKSRGWKGARTNPIQEVPITNFHRSLQDFIHGPDVHAAE